MPVGTVVDVVLSGDFYTDTKDVTANPTDPRFGQKAAYWKFTPPSSGMSVVSCEGSAGSAIVVVLAADADAFLTSSSPNGPVPCAVTSGDDVYFAVMGNSGDGDLTGDSVITVYYPLDVPIDLSGGPFTVTRDLSVRLASLFGLKTGWWSYVPTADGTLNVDLTGSVGDYAVNIYEEIAGGSQNIVDSNVAASAPLSVPVVAGVRYFIAINGWVDDSSLTGDVVLTVTFAGDGPAGAVEDVTLDSDGFYTTTRDVTVEPAEPLLGGLQTAWWSFTAPADGEVTADTLGSGWNTKLFLLDDAFAVLDSNDDATGDGESRVVWDAVEGTLYYLAVQGGTDDSDVTDDVILTVAQPVAPAEEAPGEDPPSVPDLEAPATAAYVYRVSETYPAPSFTDGVLDEDWEPTSVTKAPVGFLRVVAGGTDVTDFRNGVVEVADYTRSEPFGSRSATLRVTKATPFDSVSTIPWLVFGNTIDVVLKHVGSGQTVLWSGEIGSIEPSASEDDWDYTVACYGTAWRAGQQNHKPNPLLTPTDIGTVIRSDLNRVVGRRYTPPTAVTTGILTSQRGSSDQKVIDRVQDLLATATTSDGSNQWTVAEDSPRVLTTRLKDRTTQDWTVVNGQPGLGTDLSKDRTTAPNCFYGHGIRKDGYAWSRRVYPLARNLTYVAYPGSFVNLGDTGANVETVQERLLELGYRVAIDGTFSGADEKAVEAFQDDRGLLVDGVVGPQTWAALFPQYPTNFLDNSFRLPLAIDTRVKPRLWYPDGADAGANPDYVQGYPRIEVDIAFGENISLAEATRSAKGMLAREKNPGWAGTITMNCDPQEGSIFEMREGQNIRVEHYETTGGPLLHIAEITVSPASLTATLRVDQKAHDLITLAAIKQRNLDAVTTPTLLPRRSQRASMLSSDAVIRFDGESPAGYIRKLALIGGLWVGVNVPVSEVGTVASLTLHTSPAKRFVVAFFGDLSVTPADLIAHVGANPLAARGDGYGPFDHHARQLENLGFIQAYGGPGQAAGYDRNDDNDGSGYGTSPHDGTETTVTGTLRQTSGWSYRSTRPPFLKAFFWCADDTVVRGRLLPAPLDV